MTNAAARAYYNEIDPFAAAWLRQLIAANLIAPGDVDERSILDVRPADLRDYTQCHFFAGIGVWSYALRLAGWPDDRAVWTGSCPCQPFSTAGKGEGFTDERHLWPAFFHLIDSQRPNVIFGEQVASADGLAWLDLVQADLEGTHYTSWAVDLCAASVGAPHIRQRLWWIAECLDDAPRGRRVRRRRTARKDGSKTFHHGVASNLADADLPVKPRQRGDRGKIQAAKWLRNRPADSGGDDFMAHASGAGFSVGQIPKIGPGNLWHEGKTLAPNSVSDGHAGGPGPLNGLWRDADWLFCRDGNWRPVEPGTFPLAHGASARVGRLRGYGNAINAVLASEVIGAFIETEVS